MSMSWRSYCAMVCTTCSNRTAPSVWLRLSTRQLQQPDRTLDPAAVIAGAHWVVPPGEGAPLAMAYQGPGRPGGRSRLRRTARGCPGTPGCWRSRARTASMPAGSRPPVPAGPVPAPLSHIERILAPLARGRRAGHDPRRSPRRPFPGSAPSAANASFPLGPDRFGQERRLAGPLPGVWDGRGDDPGRVRAGAACKGLRPYWLSSLLATKAPFSFRESLTGQSSWRPGLWDLNGSVQKNIEGGRCPRAL